jgi:hypothetical protein
VLFSCNEPGTVRCANSTLGDSSYQDVVVINRAVRDGTITNASLAVAGGDRSPRNLLHHAVTQLPVGCVHGRRIGPDRRTAVQRYQRVLTRHLKPPPRKPVRIRLLGCPPNHRPRAVDGAIEWQLSEVEKWTGSQSGSDR